MTLWKDVIHIPEAHQDDRFVLKLSNVHDEERAQEIIQTYVVTDAVRKSFEEALGGIAAAVQGQERRGYFLHGTFGSGKSHFMAILHLILTGNKDALSIPRLAGVVDKFRGELGDKKFLLVPFHFIDAHSIEQRVFRDYIDTVQRLHPEAPLPALLSTDRILDTLKELHAALGDETFIEQLNQSTQGEQDEIAALMGEAAQSAGTWTLDRYERARQAHPGTKIRAELLRTAANLSVFKTAFNYASGSAAGSSSASIGTSEDDEHWNVETYVDLDAGLHEMGLHAKELGYDGLILFLDELILWLMAQSFSTDFVQKEVSKLVKFVESRSQSKDEVPIISFIARQKQFADFLDYADTGQKMSTIGSAIEHFQKRFHEIDLPSHDIAEIAYERLLKPKDAEAERRIQDSFDQKIEGFTRAGTDTLTTLVPPGHDRDQFRKVYPFTPVLTDVLIVLSEMLQRNRSALQVMTRLLVARRDTLKLGDLISVGHLWEVLHNERPMSANIRSLFEDAQKLWADIFDPWLRERYGLPPKGTLRPGEHTSQMYAQDALIIQTLLLQKLAPNATSLQNLRASTLVTLNQSDIRGQLGSNPTNQVLGRLKTMSTELHALQIGTDSNPTIEIILSKVDIEKLIQEHQNVDRGSARENTFRKLFLNLAGRPNNIDQSTSYKFPWAAERRPVEIRFLSLQDANISDYQSDGTLRLIVDYPFTMTAALPRDNAAKLNSQRENTVFKSRKHRAFSIVWMPHHFSDRALRMLGTLVTIEYILSHYDETKNSLPSDQQGEAQKLLERREDSLRRQLESLILSAYHLSDGGNDELMGERLLNHDEHFTNNFLDDVRMKRPTSTTVEGAVEELFNQAFRLRYPNAPSNPELPSEPLSNKALETLSQTLAHEFESQTPSFNLTPLDTTLRKNVLAYGEPLKLIKVGKADSNRVQLSDHWDRHFKEAISKHAPSRLDVAWLREQISPEDQPTGIPEPLQDVIIIAWAAHTKRAFADLTGAVSPVPGRLPSEYVLQDASLPSDEDWDIFYRHREALLGHVKQLRNSPRGVDEAARIVREHFSGHLPSLQNLHERLNAIADELQLDPEEWKNAARHKQLLITMELCKIADDKSLGPDTVITQVAQIIARNKDTAWERIHQQTRDTDAQIHVAERGLYLDLFDLAKKDPTHAIIKEAQKTLCYAESVTALSELRNASGRARKFILEAPQRATPPAATLSTPTSVPAETPRSVSQESPQTHASPFESVQPSQPNDDEVQHLELTRENVDDIVKTLRELLDDPSAEYTLAIRKK